MNPTTGARVFGVALLLGTAAPALSHEISPDNELPGGGTQHEIRVTTITTFVVAQQITQRQVCGFPSVCLHDELHLPVVINFETGEIAIDATAPTDENEVPVLPGAPGGILFNTQSGPAELVLAPPCENPDGCVGGTSIYLGSIDAGGNISFPSIGLNFELFGVQPVAMFDAPMGTGTSIDDSDPSVIAQGSPLDFATGEVALRGVQLVASPVVGNAMQLNTIRGIIFPVPVPPVETRSLLKCHRGLARGGTVFVKKKIKALGKCVERLLECQILQESGGPVPGSCSGEASSFCTSMAAKIAKAEERFSTKLSRSCRDVGAGNLLAKNKGLNFGAAAPQCGTFGIDTTSTAGLTECAVRQLECSVDQMIARVEPRASEVLAAAGFIDFLDPDGCLVPFASGDASGTDGEDLLACQSALDGRGGKYVTKKQAQLHKCVDGFIHCTLRERLDGLGGPGLVICQAEAQQTCEVAVRKIAEEAARRDAKLAQSCADVDASGIPDLLQGLGFANLVQHCQSQSPPIALNSVSDLIACLGSSLDCAAEAAIRSVEPQAAEIMSAVSVSGDAILDLYPCLAGSCGDGIVDVGEECDPLFPVDQSCNPDCTLVVCGDGDVEGDEECDDGNTSDGDGCSALCTDEPFACGNSVIEAFGSEVCDDGDSHGGDGCSADCLSDETCGNGVTDTLVGEACDDGGTADGDGCSADCGSDETCGNGVIDAIAGEACDDGNTAAGDGCDGACAFEGCGFFNSAGPLGMRLYSVDPTVGGLFNSIVGLGTAVGNIGFTSGPFELVATATDATGTAVVTLATDVIIGMPNLGGFTQCLKFEAAGSTGTLHCCGGHAVGMSFTRDSNRGGIGGNGPGVPLAGRGAGAPGDLAFAFQVSEGFAPQATPSDCATTTYGSPSSRYLLWTTGTATGRVVRPEQGGAVMEFSTTGQAFDCSMWTVENDIGSMVSADTALNAIPGFDAANVRILDDQAGD